MAERLQTAGHPFTVGGGFDHNPSAGPDPEHGGEAFGLGADPALDDLATIGEDVDLTFPLVHVDANMVHGWPLLSAALTARCSCGAAYATTLSERPVASSDLRSRVEASVRPSRDRCVVGRVCRCRDSEASE